MGVEQGLHRESGHRPHDAAASDSDLPHQNSDHQAPAHLPLASFLPQDQSNVIGEERTAPIDYQGQSHSSDQTEEPRDEW